MTESVAKHKVYSSRLAKKMATSKRPKLTARALFNHWRAIIKGAK